MWLLLAGLTLAGVAVALVARLLQFMNYLQGESAEPLGVFLDDPSSLQQVSLPSIFSPPTKALSIIIPAYNEQDRLGATLEETISYLQQRRNRQGPHFTWEIIVVDDGSKDKTVRVAMQFVQREGFDTVRVLRVPVNRGKGHAVKRGMLCARGEYCLMMDADGATRFRDLEKLEADLAKLITPGGGAAAGSGSSRHQASAAAIVPGEGGPLGAALGSRAHLSKSAAAKRSRIRNFLTQGFHFLVTFVAGGRIRDTQCGFKLFTRRAAGVLYANQRLQRWCFDVELIYLAEVLGVPLTEVFVEWTEMPGSKIRATSIISMAIELCTIKLAYQVCGLWHVNTELELRRKVS